MRFYDFNFEEQLTIINNSYEYSKKSFYQIEEDIKIELMSYAEVENKFNDIKNETLGIQDNIKNCLVSFNSNRSIAQAKKNYWSIFKAFDVIEIEEKIISEKFILIFQNTYYCMLYFKTAKLYEDDILKSTGFILSATIRGSIIEKDKARVLTMLHKVDDMISLSKSSENHFFYQSLSRYGTMGMDKKKVLQGFVNKMRDVLSAKRETILVNIEKLPNISMESYLHRIKEEYSFF